MSRSGASLASRMVQTSAIVLAFAVAMPAHAATPTTKQSLRPVPAVASSKKTIAPEQGKSVSGVQSSKASPLKSRKVVYATRYSGSSYGISCVPYARAVTGMDIKGNAKDWWGNAAGTFARGNRPEAGSVLSFRETGGMRLGHVAVVTRIVDSRRVEIDHANWRGPGATKGNVFKSIPVVDVSDGNDWSRVRVGLGHTGDFGGTVYPTNGFIFDRPDDGRAPTAVRYAREGASTPSAWRDAELIHRQIR